MLLHSLGGGTGSGLGSFILEQLEVRQAALPCSCSMQDAGCLPACCSLKKFEAGRRQIHMLCQAPEYTHASCKPGTHPHAMTLCSPAPAKLANYHVRDRSAASALPSHGVLLYPPPSHLPAPRAGHSEARCCPRCPRRMTTPPSTASPPPSSPPTMTTWSPPPTTPC